MLEISLRENTVMLDNVIVTALGLEKDESTLAYSTQKIKGEELNRVKEINMITALAGKAAGVQVNKNSSGMGGSAKITLQGVRSVSGDNQPLYVIDGVPMSNTSPEQAYSAIGGTANAGNRMEEMVSQSESGGCRKYQYLERRPSSGFVWKFGCQWSNPDHYQKGNSTGKRSIHFSTGLTFEKAFSLPQMQK